MVPAAAARPRRGNEDRSNLGTSQNPSWATCQATTPRRGRWRGLSPGQGLAYVRFLPASLRLSRQRPLLLRSRSFVPPPCFGTCGTLPLLPAMASLPHHPDRRRICPRHDRSVADLTPSVNAERTVGFNTPPGPHRTATTEPPSPSVSAAWRRARRRVSRNSAHHALWP